MADYDSALPVRGNVQDGDSVYAENTVLVVAGTDGSNYQAISTDSDGQIQTAHDVNTNPIFSKVTDGTTDLEIATDGALAKTTGIQIMGTDGTNAQILKTDSNGVLAVNIGGGTKDGLIYGTANLVKDTPTQIASASDKIVSKIIASGSGLMKVEIFYGTTGAETVKLVGFNSTANPNVVFEFPNGLTVADTETVYVRCTNLENRPSPASDFSGYATIFTEEAA